MAHFELCVIATLALALSACSSSHGEHEAPSDCGCAAAESYACGVDDHTYGACAAECMGIDVAHDGPCECPATLCARDCPEGFHLNAQGCPTCRCVESVRPCSDDSQCEPGQLCHPPTDCPECDDDTGSDCGSCLGQCVGMGPICEQTTCDLTCEYGHLIGSSGCPTCECASPRDDSCAGAMDCGADQRCVEESCRVPPNCHWGECELSCYSVCESATRP